MSAAESHIDQVIIRKVGGYNLKTVDWWKQQSPAQQMEMVSEGIVQFFASGIEIAAADAAAELAAPATSQVGLAVNRAATAAAGAPILEWPAFGSDPVMAKYVRRVVEGPRWLVSRIDSEAEVDLYVVRGHPDGAVYDVTTPQGATQLSNDLVLDALGYGEDLLSNFPKAVDHFKTTIFDQHLGNRPWQITAERLRVTFETNPYLRLSAQTELESQPAS